MGNSRILTIHQISSKIIEIIENSDTYCFLVTPYFKPWPVLTRALIKAAQKEKQIVFIVRKDSNNKQAIEQLNSDYGFDIVYVERLHTKIYMNEKEVLISSMNLYDSSKEYNYEIGYVIASRSDSRQFKEQIIEDDLLGIGNNDIIKGRYFTALEKQQEAELEKLRERERVRKESEDKRKRLTASKTANDGNGFCIRCGLMIPEDNSNPMCMKCYKSWAFWENVNFAEKYCHTCGGQTGGITFRKSVCGNCF